MDAIVINRIEQCLAIHPHDREMLIVPKNRVMHLGVMNQTFSSGHKGGV
jgi:hypothetical protein